MVKVDEIKFSNMSSKLVLVTLSKSLKVLWQASRRVLKSLNGRLEDVVRVTGSSSTSSKLAQGQSAAYAVVTSISYPCRGGGH